MLGLRGRSCGTAGPRGRYRARYLTPCCHASHLGTPPPRTSPALMLYRPQSHHSSITRTLPTKLNVDDPLDLIPPYEELRVTAPCEPAHVHFFIIFIDEISVVVHFYIY